MFDENICTRCGICLESCPAIDLDISQAQEEIENLINGSSFIVDKCLVCGTCDLNCPEGLTPMALIKDLKYVKMEELEKKGQTSKLVKFILPFSKPNFFEFYEETMMTPKESANLKAWKAPTKTDELVLLGCAISYPMQNFYKNPTIEGLLKGKSLAGGVEFCCGEMYHRLCYPISKTEIENRLYSKFSDLGVNKLLIFCNECYEAYHTEYKKIAKDFDMMSIWEYIFKAIKSGELNISNELDIKVTYHDPCSAKKHTELMKYPREIIKATGAELIELKHNSENALCCGIAAGLNGLSAIEKIRKKRFKEIKQTRGEYILTTCPGCILNFALDPRIQRKFKILSVLDLLRFSCGEKIDLNKNPVLINKLLNKALTTRPDLLI
ncbi:MAG: (Fe-S)-binding protein [Candidatus Helarchaeota archaeon]|nr:(Fe-S)-binding protein [Candidatus Helarchaeota archaeon]